MEELIEPYTGASVEWVVPSGVTMVYAIVAGARAQGIAANLSVVPGETLVLRVGGPSVLGAGGWPDGGDGGLNFADPIHPVSSGGCGSSRLLRSSTPLMVGGGRAGPGVVGSGGTTGSTGEVTGIGGPLPGPSESPRVPVTSAPQGPVNVPGNVGNEAVGAESVSADDGDFGTVLSGAGGGGWGGGASGSIFDVSPLPFPESDPLFPAAGRDGGWYSTAMATPDVFASDLYGDPDYDGGVIVLRWNGPGGRGGWSTGFIGF